MPHNWCTKKSKQAGRHMWGISHICFCLLGYGSLGGTNTDSAGLWVQGIGLSDWWGQGQWPQFLSWSGIYKKIGLIWLLFLDESGHPLISIFMIRLGGPCWIQCWNLTSNLLNRQNWPEVIAKARITEFHDTCETLHSRNYDRLYWAIMALLMSSGITLQSLLRQCSTACYS